MQTKPEPNQIESQNLADLTGYSVRHLRDLAKAGWFPPPEHGRYKRDAAFKGIIAHLRDLAKKSNDSEKKSRAKYWEVKQRAALFDLEREQGKHLLTSEVVPAVRNLCLNARHQLQMKLEHHLPTRLVGLAENEIRQHMRDTVDAYLAAMHDGASRWLKAPPQPQTPSQPQP